MLIRLDGHRQLRGITVHVEHNALLTYVCSQGMPGRLTPVLMTPVLHHPQGRCAAMKCIPVLVPPLIWALLHLHFF